MPVSEQMAAVLADILLTVHVGIVLFLVGGLVFIWIGTAFRWQAAGNRLFRYIHLATMGVVLLQTIAEHICPLTTWEARLREYAGQDSYGDATFVQYWMQRLLYWDWSPSTFMIMYATFFAALCITFLVVPPARKK